jgi:hypothetical protein
VQSVFQLSGQLPCGLTLSLSEDVELIVESSALRLIFRVSDGIVPGSNSLSFGRRVCGSREGFAVNGRAEQWLRLFAPANWVLSGEGFASCLGVSMGRGGLEPLGLASIVDGLELLLNFSFRLIV